MFLTALNTLYQQQTQECVIAAVQSHLGLKLLFSHTNNSGYLDLLLNFKVPNKHLTPNLYFFPQQHRTDNYQH